MTRSATEMLLLKGLEHIRFGTLALTLPDGSTHHFEGPEAGPSADIRVRERSAISAVVTQGDIGFAESYMRGEWDTDDLATLMHFVCQNVSALEHFFHGNRLFRLFFAILHRLRPNTKTGSKKNIHAHYDLGNDFYSLWLDETMTYSSAIYKTPDVSLEQAQHAKYDRIIERLAEARQGERVLEIGCGWGGFAESAAREGMHVTGLTLSEEQAAFARERLQNKADIAIRDYRDERGLFDHIVSIEMFEAVGERYWPAYFDTLKHRLSEGGRALIQTITIADDVFPHYRMRGDFIQRHIFPGGMLPSKEIFEQLAHTAGLKVQDAFTFGRDYARTLSEWLARFDAKRSEVTALGFSEEFIRKWRFYLAYCLGAFASSRTDVVQYELAHA